ncbi:hypothetical protein AERO8C_30086 [Aeromonas veronii]|uniref:Uncharacterized protein n=1 Tax=Aeromonas veronii TaxID=654 RepID=A0A653L608_AERVE|nr:hypothetical protein AERO8C_30086 [Aeromonas veronii]
MVQLGGVDPQIVQTVVDTVHTVPDWQGDDHQQDAGTPPGAGERVHAVIAHGFHVHDAHGHQQTGDEDNDRQQHGNDHATRTKQTPVNWFVRTSHCFLLRPR